MYFPYFRGRKYELAAVRSLVPLIRSSANIMPIVEPVVAKKGSDEVGLPAVEKLIGTNVPMVVVANPQKGAFKSNPLPVENFLSGLLAPDIVAGFIVSTRTDPRSVAEFLERHSSRSAAILHWGSVPQTGSLKSAVQAAGNVKYHFFLDGRNSSRYMHEFSQIGQTILLVDGFQKQPKNEDYPERSFFSDIHRTFRARGFDGFGDFLIVGDEFKDGGGQAYAVALHLSNREAENDLYVRHFVSDTTEGRGVDTPGKFLEALGKMVAFIESGENWKKTDACKEFIELYQQKHYPGLGTAKRISMRHHVEMVAALVSGQKKNRTRS